MAYILRVFVWILGKAWKVNGFRICSIMAHIFFRHILYPELLVTSQNILLKCNKTKWNQTESHKIAFYPSKSKKNLNFMPSSPLKFQQIPLLLGSFNPSDISWKIKHVPNHQPAVAVGLQETVFSPHDNPNGIFVGPRSIVATTSNGNFRILKWRYLPYIRPI